MAKEGHQIASLNLAGFGPTPLVQQVGRNSASTGDPHLWQSIPAAGTCGRLQIDKDAVFATASILIDVSYSLGKVCSGAVM
jgi:hypothetical protein